MCVVGRVSGACRWVALYVVPLAVLTAIALTAAAMRHGSGRMLATDTRGEIRSGQTKGMGRGFVRSWVRLDAQGKPASLGVTFDEAALEGLPETGPKHCCEGPEYVLEMPRGIEGLPFDHTVINWNPKGHPPEGVYDVPHFDFHFYLITAEQRGKITAQGNDAERACRALAPECTPSGYQLAPGAVPRMGAHWFDPASPEFAGKCFTRTFLYGSYNGAVTFLEPMITKAYLETKPNDSEPIKQPKTYPTRGVFPTSYTVKYDLEAHEYTVALEGLTRR